MDTNEHECDDQNGSRDPVAIRAEILERVEQLDNERDQLTRERVRLLAAGDVRAAAACGEEIGAQVSERVNLSIALNLLTTNPSAARIAMRSAEERPGRLTPDENHGFGRLRFIGRNQRGVPMYEGDLDLPSKRAVGKLMGHRLSGILVTLILIGFWSTIEVRVRFLREDWVPIVAAAIFALWGTVTLTQVLHKRRILHSGLSVERLGEQFGMPELSVIATAREHGVNPVCIINGKEQFRLTDFGEAGILLRAAEPPADETALLRPAGTVGSDTHQLLRVADTPATRKLNDD